MNDLNLRFLGRDPHQSSVPAGDLARALEGLQRVVHLLALQHEGTEVRQRVRVPREPEQKYVLVVEAIEPGSFVVPLRLGDPSGSLSEPGDVEAVGRLLESTLVALETAAEAALRSVIPDAGLRTRVVDAARKMLPRSGSGYSLRIGGRDGTVLASSEGLTESLRSLQVGPETRQELTTVTGALDQINFSRRTITILHAPTNRALECSYEPAVEELLLQNPRDLIQITGRVVVDDEGSPLRIYDVIDIVEVDLSPLFLSEVPVPGGLLRFRAPLILYPELDESQQTMAAVDAELGIDAFNSTRAELLREVASNVRFLWRTYATAEPERLSPGALRRKQALLERIEFEAHAEE